MLWATNHRQSEHLLLQPVLAKRPAPPAASRDPFSLLPGSWGPRGIPGLAARVRPSASEPWWRESRGARHPARGQRSSPPRARRGFWGRVKGLVWHPQASGGRSLSHRGARPLFPAFSLGPPPSRSVGPRRSGLSPSLLRAPSSPPESLQLRPPPPAGSRGASPDRPSHGGARTPGAPGRLPREGARPPPRLHPLGGAAAIWGPCQSRPFWGPRRARAGGGSPGGDPGPPTGRSPAGTGEGNQALRCPEGAVAASRARVEARRSGRGHPSPLQ